MAALIGPVARRFALALAILPPPAPAADKPAASQLVLRASPSVERWRTSIEEASRRFGISPDWIAAVMQAESAGLTQWNGRPITSHAGAMGLMQVMPDTYTAMRLAHHLGADPYDPHDNILAGAAYLRAMYDRYGYPGFFAAYNAGPARYERHLRDGEPLPDETRFYIAQLARTPATPSIPPSQPFQPSPGFSKPGVASPAILSGTRLFFTLGSVEKPARTGPEAAPGNADPRTARFGRAVHPLEPFARRRPMIAARARRRAARASLPGRGSADLPDFVGFQQGEARSARLKLDLESEINLLSAHLFFTRQGLLFERQGNAKILKILKRARDSLIAVFSCCHRADPDHITGSLGPAL